MAFNLSMAVCAILFLSILDRASRSISQNRSRTHERIMHAMSESQRSTGEMEVKFEPCGKGFFFTSK